MFRCREKMLNNVLTMSLHSPDPSWTFVGQQVHPQTLPPEGTVSLLSFPTGPALFSPVASGAAG